MIMLILALPLGIFVWIISFSILSLFLQKRFDKAHYSKKYIFYVICSFIGALFMGLLIYVVNGRIGGLIGLLSLFLSALFSFLVFLLIQIMHPKDFGRR